MRTRSHHGFTLVEMMIVVGILAIIVALAIPDLLRSRIAANETSAIGTLRMILTAEAVIRQNDTDRNTVGDYWTGDVSGFNRIERLGAPGVGVAMLDEAIGESDDAKLGAGAAIAGAAVPGTGTAAAGLVAMPRTAAKSGYFVRAMVADAAGNPYATDPDLNGQLWTATSGFGFQARPDFYDRTGMNTYILSEGGVIFARDFGDSLAANAAVWPAANPISVGWKVVQ